jgi:hypothetical protein
MEVTLTYIIRTYLLHKAEVLFSVFFFWFMIFMITGSFIAILHSLAMSCIYIWSFCM